MKATNQAYWFVITLTAKDGKVAFANPRPATALRRMREALYFAGGTAKSNICLSRRPKIRRNWCCQRGISRKAKSTTKRQCAKYTKRPACGHQSAFVRSSPKGQTENGGRICPKGRDAAALGDKSYPVENEVVVARFYLMEMAGYGLRQDKRRRHVWLPLEQAIAQASHIETQHLLQSAEHKRHQQ